MFYFFVAVGCVAGFVSVGRLGRCILFDTFGVNLLHMFEYSACACVGKANVIFGFPIANEFCNEHARTSASAPFFILFSSTHSNDTRWSMRCFVFFFSLSCRSARVDQLLLLHAEYFLVMKNARSFCFEMASIGFAAHVLQDKNFRAAKNEALHTFYDSVNSPAKRSGRSY